MVAKLDKQKLLSEVLLQPWFIDLKTARAVRRILPVDWFHKMRYYFDDYGCMICSKRDAIYASNGMCRGCVDMIQKRLIRSLFRRRRPTIPKQFQMASFSRVKTARLLLSDLISYNQKICQPEPIRSTTIKTRLKVL